MPYSVEPVAYSSWCIHFPLDALDYVISTSSSSCLTSCVGFFSTSTCIVVDSYSGVWIFSTSTTVGISFFSVCGTRVLLRVFRPVFLNVPTLGGDMFTSSRLQTSKSLSAIKNSPPLSLPLVSVLYSLSNNTLSFFPPFLDFIVGQRSDSCAALKVFPFSIFVVFPVHCDFLLVNLSPACSVFNHWFSCSALFILPVLFYQNLPCPMIYF